MSAAPEARASPGECHLPLHHLSVSVQKARTVGSWSFSTKVSIFSESSAPCPLLSIVLKVSTILLYRKFSECTNILVHFSLYSPSGRERDEKEKDSDKALLFRKERFPCSLAEPNVALLAHGTRWTCGPRGPIAMSRSCSVKKACTIEL